MAIEKIGSNLVRPLRSGGSTRASTSTGQADADELKRVERADRVEISDEGRQLAAKSVDGTSGSAEARNDAIRSRIQSGFYDDPAVAEQVAGHLITSGDLDITT